MEEKNLRLDGVVVDNALNPRIGALDQETVQEYAEHIEDLPLMHVFLISGQYVLTRGFHRYAAHQLAGLEEATFVIHQGTSEEAHEDADLDNLRHGLHLSRSEKRAVIGRYLKRHPERSDVWVAKDCYTTDKTVRSVRQELEQRSEIPRLDNLVGTDGVERPRSVERPAVVEKEPVEDVPEWLNDDGFIKGEEKQEAPPAPRVDPPAPAPKPAPPPAPKLPPPPPPVVRELSNVYITVRVEDDGRRVVIMGNQGSHPLDARPVELGQIGAEVQRLVDEVMAVKAIA